MSNKDITMEQINVLGKTFSSDEERRKYFREELRKKLPELKKMEGFPIGDDEDIIQLSDPPFYTACPNPWLNNFVQQWEEEKNELEKRGEREPDFEMDEPYAADVSVGKNNPMYMAHSYHTKVPHPAIMRYILHYTQPGDIVFDGFAGTGMTGVAAEKCEAPEAKEKIGIESEFNNKKINWGRRFSICGDLSTISTSISHDLNKKIDISEFVKKAADLVNDLENEYSWVYETQHSNGNICKVDYYIWNEIFACPNCQSEIPFWEYSVSHNRKKQVKTFDCSNCGIELSKKNLQKVYETGFDPVLNKIERKVKFSIAQVCYRYKGKRIFKSPDEFDFENLKKVDSLILNNSSFISTQIIPNGDKTGEPIRLGLSHTHQLFTDRNAFILGLLRSKINFSEGRLKSLFTSIILNSSKLYRWRANGKGGYLNGTLYIASLNQENNIFKILRKKIESWSFSGGLSNVTSCMSATNTGLVDNSIDYIFTDPPFGANLMYSELNLLIESWLNVLTNNTIEAIENKTQNKDVIEYGRIMNKSFLEFNRVLKPGRFMTVEFSNTGASIWNSLQTALQNSGFVICNVAALDKKQGSYNSVTNATSVKQDLVISCYKPSSEFDLKFKEHQSSNEGIWDFIEDHLQYLPVHVLKNKATTAIIERSSKILFDRLIAFYVQKNLPVPIDSGKFQLGLRERFAERDGMYFTQEQVQEYDKKKAEAPEFIQLSILVSSEQDGVIWLKNLLQEKPLTYQDIHPQWMQALAGVRKGDIIPELSDILEENFLDDKQGKWYVPDPEKEADLERVRNRRLLKQYEEYKKEASKPKGKIKEARVEALRAGFKQSYQYKDFKTIVQVGDRIPNQLLMEDEVLLQFYDIASSRV